MHKCYKVLLIEDEPVWIDAYKRIILEIKQINQELTIHQSYCKSYGEVIQLLQKPIAYNLVVLDIDIEDTNTEKDGITLGKLLPL